MNMLTQEKCKELYKRELRDPKFVEHAESTKTDGSKHRVIKTTPSGCIITKRKCRTTGYPVIQLSVDDVPQDYKSVDKQLRKVLVHHLAYRAYTGELIKEDIHHTCGMGKKIGSKDDEMRGCINWQHLAQVSHKVNMQALNCVPLHKCPCCKTIFNDCPHNPRCAPTGPLLEEFKKQQQEQKKD